MIDRIVISWGMIFQYLLWILAGGLFFAYLHQGIALQNQAQFIAISMGKFGGYTTEADNSVREYVTDMKIPTSDMKVKVSAPNNPVPWGTPVWAELRVNFRFKIGTVINIVTPLPITKVGRSVSAYEPGNYSVTYTSPTYY